VVLPAIHPQVPEIASGTAGFDPWQNGEVAVELQSLRSGGLRENLAVNETKKQFPRGISD